MLRSRNNQRVFLVISKPSRKRPAGTASSQVEFERFWIRRKRSLPVIKQARLGHSQELARRQPGVRKTFRPSALEKNLTGGTRPRGTGRPRQQRSGGEAGYWLVVCASVPIARRYDRYASARRSAAAGSDRAKRVMTSSRCASSGCNRSR